MGYFDTIYIITEEKPDTTLVRKQWFWDKEEAEQFYQNQLYIEDRVITLYAFDLRDTINERIDALMANRHSNTVVSPLQEIRSSRPAPATEDITWTELEYRPEGYFYVEMLKRSTSEYWPYRAELGDQQVIVFDHTSDQIIATIEPHDDGRSFRVTVNDVTHGTLFTNLKAAVIFAATEYNGV